MLITLLGMSKRYGVRPSLMLDVDDAYAAYCLDEACLYIQSRIEIEGRMPRALEKLAEPQSNAETVQKLINSRGVDHNDYRRINIRASDS